MNNGFKDPTINALLENASVVGVDVDGTLCYEICWTPKDCLVATPRQEVIDKVRELYLKQKYIVIATSRKPQLAEATLMWLDKNNVPYHAIDFRKTACDVLIDDKVINVEDFIKKTETKK